MALIISTGDVQIRWNVLSLLFKGKESGKWPLGLSDFYITILSVMIVFSTLENIHLPHLIKTILLYSNMTFFIGF